MTASSLPISVVIASHNSKKWLSETIDSINEADCVPQEILLIDDASTDGTLEYSRELVKLHSNLRLIELSKNVGAAKARLRGIEESFCDWICFVDADDKLGKNALSQATHKINSDVDVVLFELWRFVSDSNFWRDDSNPRLEELTGEQAFFESMGSWNIHAFGIYRKAVFLSAYQELSVSSFNEDEILTRIIFKLSRKVSFSCGYYWYRLNDESITRGVNLKFPGVLQSHAWLIEHSSSLPKKRKTKIFKQAIKDCYRLSLDQHLYNQEWVQAELSRFFERQIGVLYFWSNLGFNPKYIWYYIRSRLKAKQL